MLFTEQRWEFLAPPMPAVALLKSLETAGRTCYKSEKKMTENSAKEFVARIIRAGHHSVLEHVNIGVRIVTDRGVTHELVRHRLASYSQESTRFCNYGWQKMGVKFILPVDFQFADEDFVLLEAIEKHYNWCIQIGRTPQQARYFLPNGVKTEIVMTANLREWRHIFTLRTSAAAHPQMRELMLDMLHGFKRAIPVVFDDIET